MLHAISILVASVVLGDLLYLPPLQYTDECCLIRPSISSFLSVVANLAAIICLCSPYRSLIWSVLCEPRFYIFPKSLVFIPDSLSFKAIGLVFLCSYARFLGECSHWLIIQWKKIVDWFPYFGLLLSLVDWYSCCLYSDYSEDNIIR